MAGAGANVVGESFCADLQTRRVPDALCCLYALSIADCIFCKLLISVL